jgi:hypothetical protein
MRDSLSGELDRVVEAQRAFSRDAGFGDIDAEAVRDFSPAWQALNEFLLRHLDPALAEARGAADSPDVNPAFDGASASWILLGCGWRQADVPQTLIGRIANAITGKTAPAVATPAPALAAS